MRIRSLARPLYWLSSIAHRTGRRLHNAGYWIWDKADRLEMWDDKRGPV
jgi:hypothetical protein